MPTPEHRIRSLGPADIGPVRALLDLFGRAFDDPETYGASPPSDTYLRRALSGESLIVLAAFEGEEVIGGIAAYDLPKIERERSEIYLYDLAVAAPHRRQGVATALIAELRTVAARRGAWVIFVQADYVDPPAIALYEKLGTREDVIHFDIAVEP